MAEKQKGMLARVDQSNTSNKTNMAFEMGAWQSQSVDKQDDVISQQIYWAFFIHCAIMNEALEETRSSIRLQRQKYL